MRSAVLTVLVLGILTGPGAARAQDAGTTLHARADTFADGAARDLVLKALRLRGEAAAGLESYEATVLERTHVGMAITRRMPGRDRTIYHREQMARVHWRADGRHSVRWIGRREGSPATGVDGNGSGPFGIELDLVEELDLDDIGIDLLFDPFGDRLDVFEAEFIQPVSEEGLGRYRFTSSDTMEIRLPAPDRTITLVEVIVTPHAQSWETVEGSLWFDRETGTLVRAAYRPSGVWDHEIEEPGDLDDVPAFLKPAIGTVHSIVIEYGLYERRWWLPRRVYGEGEFDWGHGLVRMPLLVEWTMSEHVLNEPPGTAFLAPDLARVGTRIRGDDEHVDRITYLAPRGVDLAAAPQLPGPLIDSPLLAFTTGELGPLLARIPEVTGGPTEQRAPTIRRALLTSVRYDRVRGPSAALGTQLVSGNIVFDAHARAALAIPDLETTAGIAYQNVTLSVYRRIGDASDWNLQNGLGNSAATFLFGHDGGDYYRENGATLTFEYDARLLHARLETFAEAHRPIARHTNLSLLTLGGGSLRPNLEADRVDAFGARLMLAGQHGSDVRDGVFNWRIETEGATGNRDWGRALAGVRFTGGLGATSSFAIDLSAGLAGHGAPVQREFLLGGAGSIRGVRENAIHGPAFWLARAETGFGLAGLRSIAFLDTGWAGARDSFRTSRPVTGVGAGFSMLDGLMRFDVARGIGRSGVWRAYFVIDALL